MDGCYDEPLVPNDVLWYLAYLMLYDPLSLVRSAWRIQESQNKDCTHSYFFLFS